MFSFGTSQLLLLSFVALLLFGHRLPATMKSLGFSLRSFQQGLRDEDP